MEKVWSAECRVRRAVLNSEYSYGWVNQWMRDSRRQWPQRRQGYRNRPGWTTGRGSSWKIDLKVERLWNESSPWKVGIGTKLATPLDQYLARFVFFETLNCVTAYCVSQLWATTAMCSGAWVIVCQRTGLQQKRGYICCDVLGNFATVTSKSGESEYAACDERTRKQRVC